MALALPLNTLNDTKLWIHLDAAYANSKQKDLASEITTKVKSACDIAAERIKQFPYFHPQFTLHDERHFVRVAELMALVLGDDVKSLNAIEVALLLLSSYYHDQGMVPEADEWKRIQDSSEFKVSLDRWEIENPNLSIIRRQLDDMRFSQKEKESLSSQIQQHLDAHRTDFLRVTHSERTEQLVNRLFGSDDRLTVCGVNLAQILGRLCASHVWPASQLTDENSFRVDQAIGVYSINLRFLAVILRLADILDFDRDRAPEALLRTINITSPISLIEWANHRSVEGWEISSKHIRFTLACDHPAYQKSAYEFMDAIDLELREAHRIVDEFPRGTPTHYRLQIPRQVERDNIEPKNNAYRYADLEFSLSRDEIVKLFMTDKLYNSNSLFVRELIQNSLDALRHRVAVYGKGQPNWEGGEVTLKHFIDSDGNQVVSCTDDGIGMDETLVRNFLTNAGRSYYRSPEFAQQRIGFRENGVDFDPCAQFGIGFMSCFMFGDHIRINTRRDYGPGRGYGEPLEIEVSGLGGLLVIREGKVDQPVGTTVEITGSRMPAFLDDWSDDVRLCAVVEGYALATEFPITAETDIEEIKGKMEVPVTIATRKTMVEKAKVEQIHVIEYNLKDIDSRLGGTIRIGLLVDDDGVPTTGNVEAKWEARETKGVHHIYLSKDDENHRYYGLHDDTVTCMDGILICGHPGRGEDEEMVRRLGWRGNSLDLGDPFVVDIRSSLKPVITPSRQPPERTGGFRNEPSWSKVNDLLRQAHAIAWTLVLKRVKNGLSPEEFWKLSLLHRVPVHLMDTELLWRYIQLPVVSEDETDCDWVALSALLSVEPIIYGEDKNRKKAFTAPGKGRIGFSKSLSAWHPSGYGYANTDLVQLVIRFAKLDIVDETVAISVGQSESAGSSDTELGMSDGPFEYVSCLQYTGDATGLLSAQSLFRSVNSQHPVVRYVQAIQDVKYRELTDFQRYCASVMWLLSDDENLSMLAKGSVEKGRQYRRLGTIFRMIDWNRHDSDLSPPYKVWTKDRGVVVVTDDELTRWAKLPRNG